MTWSEIRELVKEDGVVPIPAATIENHGYHLPAKAWKILKRKDHH